MPGEGVTGPRVQSEAAKIAFPPETQAPDMQEIISSPDPQTITLSLVHHNA